MVFTDRSTPIINREGGSVGMVAGQWGRLYCGTPYTIRRQRARVPRKQIQ